MQAEASTKKQVAAISICCNVWCSVTSTVSSYFALPSFLKDSSSHVPYKIHSCYCYACISLIHVAEHQHITSEPARTVSLLFYLFIKGTPETTNNSSSFRYCAP
ncbi:hypothetical protein HYE67_003504 [Fusarium culmorum]|uniref:Uncharacterized protein n=1 Tax=Fusarium culmorum TaxID=5516 RepID=A0A2T4GQA9_FUSCU|nr:hypothetical protein FCULG_00000642 [Fusarium culmorum]QPC61273.1 hypothetical protein HYE67_003504 [Fusarium culmorum]